MFSHELDWDRFTRRSLFPNSPLTRMHPPAQTRDITHSCARAALGGETAGCLDRGFLVPFPSTVHAGGTPFGIQFARSATCDDGMVSLSGGVFCGVIGPSAATVLGGCGALLEMVPSPSTGTWRGGAEWGFESRWAFVCGFGRRVTLGLVAAMCALGTTSGAHMPDDSAKGGKVGAYERDVAKSSSILNITALLRILFFLCFSVVCSCSQDNFAREGGAAPY